VPNAALGGAGGWPTMSKFVAAPSTVNGRKLTMPTDWTPGSAATRLSASAKKRSV
jgi:hypothetical protein